MSIKRTALSQYQKIVDTAAASTSGIMMPKEGWIRTVRKALNMSGVQLGRRMGISRAQVLQSEKGEQSGNLTIRTMEKAAEALDCEFVYALVPHGTTQAILEKRAKNKAMAIVEEANQHMALEDQTLSQEQIEFEIERLQQEFLRDLPSDLWDDS